MVNSTFEKLSVDAKLFKELANNPPVWWKKLKSNPSVYIDIRKDNYINAYYEGGSVAKISYVNDNFKIEVHKDYLAQGNKGCSTYINVTSDDFVDLISDICENISRIYSKSTETKYNMECWSEAYIKGQFRTSIQNQYIDSEFEFNENGSSDKIDLVRIIKGEIQFVELKRIDDNRMLKKTDDDPEIINQIARYKTFVEKHSNEILDYYQRLYDIKKLLDLPVPTIKPNFVNTKPFLLIFNRWVHESKKRSIHTQRIKDLLRIKDIDFDIVDKCE